MVTDREPQNGQTELDNRLTDRGARPMPTVRSFDHVGITVADLDAVIAFFVGLGFELEGRTVLEGEFLDTVIGMPGSRTEIAMLRPPGGGTGLELGMFLHPGHGPGTPDAMANELGLRSVAFEVDDLQPILDRLAADGYRLVGGVGQYEDSWLMASVRGPEGIIVSLAQRIS
jgi:catechol 2,3-dioxygenase-like lactoylglutathione lyase family enzyme